MRGSRITAPVGGVVAAGTSVVCMASMGAMMATTTASATAGMAGMGAAAASTPHVLAITRALRAVGLCCIMGQAAKSRLARTRRQGMGATSKSATLRVGATRAGTADLRVGDTRAG